MAKQRGHFLILNRDEFRCIYCGASPSEGLGIVLTVDHIWPVQRGGHDRADNLATCCLNCNSQKQDRLMAPTVIDNFVALVRQRNLDAGISDSQVIDLGGTSSQKRSRRDWEALQFHASTLVSRMLQRNLDENEYERAQSLAEVLCLSLQLAKEYARVTGDIARSERATILLREMAVNALSLGELESLTERQAAHLQVYQDYIDTWTRMPDKEQSRAWLGGEAISQLINEFLISEKVTFSDIKVFGRNIRDIDEEFVLHWAEHNRKRRKEDDDA